MKALENAIKEIKSLQPEDLMEVYDMIIKLKAKRTNIGSKSKKIISGRARVVEALKGCRADFSSDIISHREDRL